MGRYKLLVMGVLFLFSASAFAVTTTYPGASCTPANGGTYTVDTVGAMINFGSSNYLFISCPIPNVHGAQTVSSTTIHYVDNNPNGDMLCQVRGTISGQVFRSSGASRAEQSFAFDSAGVNDGVAVVLNCWLPPNTSGAAPKLIKYTVDMF